MKMILPLSLLTCLLTLLVAGNSFAQNTSKTVYFTDIRGFSGFVTFDLRFERYATQMQGRNAKLVLTKYDAGTDQLKALLKAGYDLRGYPTSRYTPDKFGFDVEGKVNVDIISLFGAGSPHDKAKSTCKLRLNKTSNDYCTPDFDETMKEAMQKWAQRANGKSHWEETGNYYDIKVSELYITDFINEVEKILGNHKKQTEKETVDKTIADAEKALTYGNLSQAKTLLDKAYKQDPRNEKMIAVSKRYAQLKKEKEDREDNNRIVEAQINARKREQDRARDEEADLNTLRSWNAANPNNLDPQAKARLRELEKRNTDRQVAKIEQSFEAIRQESQARHEKRMQAIDEKYDRLAKAREEEYNRAMKELAESSKRESERMLKESRDREIKRLSKYGYVSGGSADNIAMTIKNMVKELPASAFVLGPAPLKFFNWGYVTKEGIPVTAFKYTSAGEFSEDLAPVAVGDPYLSNEIMRYGYINLSGNMVIPLIYSSAGNFRQGVAVVYQNHKCGLINKQGKTIIPLIHDEIAEPTDGVVRVTRSIKSEKKRRHAFYTITGEQLTGFDFESASFMRNGIAAVKKDGKWGLINDKTAIVEPLIYEEMRYSFEGSYAFVLKGKVLDFDRNGKRIDKWHKYDQLTPRLWIAKNTYDKYALVDSSRKLVTGFEFDGVKGPWNNYLYASKDKKWGMLDSNGRVVIPFKYAYLDSFSRATGIAMAINANKLYGYIDMNGKTVVPFVYTSIGNLCRGLINAKKGDKWGYIDRYGRQVVPFKYRNAYKFNAFHPVAYVQLDYGQTGLIDTTGKEVLPTIFRDISFPSGCGNNLIIVQDSKNFKYGFYDLRTLQPAGDIKYDKTYFFDAGFMRVQVADKFGFVDTSGKESVPVQYEEAKAFSKTGLASVKHKGKWGLIDGTNKVMTPFKYDLIRGFQEGLCPVNRKGKWGYVNTKGELVIPVRYEQVDYFNEGLARVQLKGKFGFINTTGEVVVPIQYDEAEDVYNGRVRVKLNGRAIYFNKRGEKL